MITTSRRSLARASLRSLTAFGAVVLTSTAVIVAAPVATAAPAVDASTSPARTAPVAPATTQTKSLAQVRAERGRRAVSIASSRKGSPYSYGAAGPRRFDCSGLTMWTFRKLGKRLPHSSAAQYGRVKHIRAKDRQRGDLVFFHDGGGIYHVAIYAGDNRIWHAPYSGTRVRKERLWTHNVWYGRVR